MSYLVQPQDFTDIFQISQSKFTDLQPWLDRYELDYMVKLLGAELYDLFIDSLESNLPTGRFLTIYNPFHTDIDEVPVVSHGMKEMLRGLLFYHYAVDNNLYHSVTGIVQNVNENSTVESGAKGMQYATNKYDMGMSDYMAIQKYIKNSSDYPEFTGVELTMKGLYW